MTQASDFREESDVLYELLRAMPAEHWTRPTGFKAWTSNDVIGHLHIFNHAAKLSLAGRDESKAFFAEIAAGKARGESLLLYTRAWLRGAQDRILLEQWRELYRQLADAYATQDPARRLAWGGPDMSARSLISARQMETWAHGQEIFDLLGASRTEGERIKNIAVLGVNTFGWTFANRGLPVPPVQPYVRLTSPGGAVWEWHAQQDSERLEGSAVDFGAVVTQTRNVADTRLRVTGPVTQQWMSLAQCFAGPPEDPPAAGTRGPPSEQLERNNRTGEPHVHR